MEKTDNIRFSFKYSASKEYSIEKITKRNKSKCNDIIYDLFNKFEELSNLKLIDILNKPKNSGYETIPVFELNLKFNEKIREDLEISNDSKIMVFRFYKQKCRLLLFQSKVNPTLLYVIGYDWGFNAYKH